MESAKNLPDDVFTWVEQTIGGRIVDIERQVRWRPHHFITIDKDGQKLRVLARSERDQSIIKHSAMMQHFDIAHEARVLEALQGRGVKVPTFYGYNDKHHILLMGAIGGTNLLAHAADDATRARIMNEYYEQLAKLHSLDVEQMRKTVPELEVPSTPEDIAIKQKFQYMEVDYVKARPNLKPEPLLDLGLWWLRHNVPQGDRRVSFVQGDTGPGQFMFEGDTITGLIDWELAHVGDPMIDLGVGRMRNMIYPTCSLKEPMKRYQAAGRTIDWEALRYYTVMSMLLTPLGTSRSVQRVTAKATDMMARFGWDVTLRRGLCDALAEVLGIQVEPPELPEPELDGWPNFHDYMVEHLELRCVPVTNEPADKHQLECAVAIAKMLQLESRIGEQLLASDLEDMAAVLGHRPRDRAEGLADLSRIVDEDPEGKLAELVSLFSRIERRREHLWMPLMVAQESAEFEPITPF